MTTDNILDLSYAQLSALAHERADRLSERSALASARGEHARAADLRARTERERERARALWRLS